MVSHTQILDALFCEEDHFDTTEENYNFLQQEEEDNSCSSHQYSLNAHSFLNLFEQDEELISLLYKEQRNEPHRGCFEEDLREEVVQWMLRVIGYYSFSALTAVLAVTYLDRFLHRCDQPWMFQLAAVACLSLAAKVDETDVPLLLDFQVEEPMYVFEPKNIQKMEILILSSLEWKMNLITPFSFLDYIARRLSLNDHICGEFLTRCERLILSVITDSRFMAYLPSTMASAAMVHLITSIEPSIDLEHHDRLLGILGINKDKVRECCTLIQEVATNVGIDANNKRKMGSLPCSPTGLFDLSFISDSSNDSWAVASNSSSVSSSPQPQFKRIKTQNAFQFSEF
ncbi:cyclin-D3-1-like [Salvia miltiorrhiza]|uniref:cyclin-D3-1-like n=1 Tax=Salvia miltiorrhiza TaxID=226208 RepID=UPI0025ACC71E|nr:cyclin-D3-1-like [Salvia miltiorrhiza]